MLYKSIICFVFLGFAWTNFASAGSADSLKAVRAEAKSNPSKVKTKVQIKEPSLYRIRTAPSFTLQINANYNYGLAELSGPYETVFEADQFLSGQNFGVRRGFGGYVTGKLPLTEEGNLRFTFSGAFNYFKNNNLSSLISTAGVVKYTSVSLGAGIENSFTPTFKVKPYLAGSVMMNLIWGEANNIITPDSTIENITFKKSFRLGYVISSGVEILVSNRVGVNIGISLHDANRVFKSSSTSDDANEFSIRDRKDVEHNPPLALSGYKQFLFTSINLGVNIYFGIKNKLFRI